MKFYKNHKKFLYNGNTWQKGYITCDTNSLFTNLPAQLKAHFKEYTENKSIMPTQLYKECWNCGKSFPVEEEYCPKCGKHEDDLPIETEAFMDPSEV